MKINKLNVLKINAIILIISMLLSIFYPIMTIDIIDATKRKLYSQNNGSIIGEPIAPVLLKGLKAVYYPDVNAGEPIELKDPLLNKSRWYNYQEGKFANAKDKANNLWVWIPRFEYRIKFYTDESKAQVKGYISDNYYRPDFSIENQNINNIKSEFYDVEIKFLPETDSPNTVSEHYTTMPAFDSKGGKIITSGFWMKKQPIKGVKKTFVDSMVETDYLAKDLNLGFSDEFSDTALPRESEYMAVYLLSKVLKGTEKVENPDGTSTGNKTGVLGLNSGEREWMANVKASQKLILEQKYTEAKQRSNKGVLNDVDFEHKVTVNKDDLLRLSNTPGNMLLTHDLMTNYSSEDASPEGGKSVYITEEKPLMARGSDRTDENKSMYSFVSKSYTDTASYRAVMYENKIEASNRLRYQFVTTEGTIYNLDTQTEHGQSTGGSTTKGNPITRNLWVKDSQRRFLKWDVNPKGQAFYEDITFRAVFEGDAIDPTEIENQSSYRVRFMDRETGTVYKEARINRGETAQNLEAGLNPTKQGKRFVGWTPSLSIPVNSDVDYIAQWEEVEENIRVLTFVMETPEGGTRQETVRVIDGTTAKAPKVDEIEGKVFVGWTPEFNEIDPVRGDARYTARYEVSGTVGQNEENLATYTIKLNGASSTNLQEGQKFKFVKGKKLTDPENIVNYEKLTRAQPNKKGYRFVSWGLNEEEVINQDKNITPQFAAKLLRFEFLNEGVLLAGDNITAGQIPSAPEVPQRPGYKFTGWSPAHGTPIYEDTVYQAVWTVDPNHTVRKHKVRFDLDGGRWNLPLEIEVEHGRPYTTGQYPVKDGYAFTRWNIEMGKPITEDTTYKAIYVSLSEWSGLNTFTPPAGFDGGSTTNISTPGTSQTNTPGNVNLVPQIVPAATSTGATIQSTGTNQPTIPRPVIIAKDGSILETPLVPISSTQTKEIREEVFPRTGSQEGILGVVGIFMGAGLLSVMYISFVKFRKTFKE